MGGPPILLNSFHHRTDGAIENRIVVEHCAQYWLSFRAPKIWQHWIRSCSRRADGSSPSCRKLLTTLPADRGLRDRPRSCDAAPSCARGFSALLAELPRWHEVTVDRVIIDVDDTVAIGIRRR